MEAELKIGDTVQIIGHPETYSIFDVSFCDWNQTFAYTLNDGKQVWEHNLIPTK